MRPRVHHLNTIPSFTSHFIMSQPLTSISVSMLQTPGPETTSSSKHVFVTALKLYKEKTKNNLENHDLFKRLESCDFPAVIIAEFRATEFDDPYQTGSGLKRSLGVLTLNLLFALSVLGAFSNMLQDVFVIIDTFLPP